ncbi:MAG: ferrous iron transport protein B [Slackia sp.]
MASRIALAGNPNCGKTTLFNALTGLSQYVGNWPGVTVEKKEGTYTHDKTVVVTDLPGIYSLSPYSPEEIVSRDYLIDERPDVVIDVVDATNLERNLYLTAQILDLGLPVVVALNMADLVRKSGDVIDKAKLSATLGCPVVETSALKGEGIDELMSAAVAAAKSGAVPEPRMRFDEAVEEALCRLEAAIGRSAPARLGRWYAIKLLEGEQRSIEALKPASDTLDMAAAIRRDLEERFDDDAESIVTAERYDAIAHAVDETVVKSRKGMSLTQKIDRIVTNRWLGLPIFVLVMTFVYFIAVSTVGHVATDWANDGVFGDGWQYTQDLFIPGIPTYIDAWLTSIDCAPWLQSLILDGIVAGVGAVLGFVPQMIVLFLMLSFLEGCGYMARVAFIMDRIFRKFGLSGKSFIPMLIASGCGVPAIMATKTIENERDRRMTIMTTTMIPCGAKLPIIALVFGALAGQVSDGVWWIAPLFYFMGVAAIVVSGIMLRKTCMFAGEPTPFVMELPQYHLPTARSVFAAAWERVKSFIVKAGTVIFLASIVIWALLNLGFYEGTFGLLDTEMDDYIQYSLMAMLGGVIAPVFAPLGFGDWQSVATSITGLVAKENVVSTVGIITSLGDAGEADASMWQAFSAMFAGSAPAIAAFCAFNLLCAPCFAAIGTIRRQMESAKWTWFAIGYMTVFAYAVALMIYQFATFFATGAFGWGTAAASVVLAALLFQLFRPMPDYRDGKRTEASAVLQRA